MKIKSIKIKNHKILGNLNLDFTDDNGNIYDNVIFIGENGCGKTTILNFISTMLDYKQNVENDIKNSYNYVVKILLSEDELKNINNGLSVYNLAPLIKNEIEVTYNPTSHNNCNLQYSFSNIPRNSSFSFLSVLQKYCVSIYATTQINLNSRSIDSVKASNIDCKVDKPIKATENLGNEIKQLFIDITTNDANDLLYWVYNNPGLAPNEEIIYPRIKRFNNAFSSIFNDKLSFERVESVNNKKEVYFKNHGEDVKIDDLSSGEKQLIYRGAFLLKDKASLNNALALIDEPEISMHPKWQLNILDYYKSLFKDSYGEQTSQMFLTSHSEYLFKNKKKDDLVYILTKDKKNNIAVKKYEEQNILPFDNFAENKYFAFDIPTLEFFNELYAYIGWKTNMKVDDYISQFKTKILSKYNKYCNFMQWQKDNGKIVKISPITYIRHEIHHPENHLNTKLYNNDEDLREPIEFMLYLIKTFNI